MGGSDDPPQQLTPQQILQQQMAQQQAANVDSITLSVAAVSLSLPTYWPLNPDAWFTKVEAQLKNARISNEETAYYKVLAVLPESAAIKVREISQKPKFEIGDYDRIKAKLIASGQPSTLERMDRLCELRQVVHKKPSEIVTDLENIFHSAIGEHKMPMNDYMRKFWWLRALPKATPKTLHWTLQGNR